MGIETGQASFLTLYPVSTRTLSCDITVIGPTDLLAAQKRSTTLRRATRRTQLCECNKCRVGVHGKVGEGRGNGAAFTFVGGLPNAYSPQAFSSRASHASPSALRMHRDLRALIDSRCSRRALEPPAFAAGNRRWPAGVQAAAGPR